MSVFHFILEEATKSTKNIWKLVIEKVVVLGFLMANSSSKQYKMYILGENAKGKYVTFLLCPV